MTDLPVEYGPLVRELHRRAAAERRPINGTFELTARCNLSCRMCYIHHSASDITRRAEELSPTAWITLAREAVDNGMLFLLLTGGEVFLRPDFFKIYTPLTRLGLILTLFTNGTLITDAVAQELAQAPPNRTEITLYGASEATYEEITGVPGSYRRCCAGIEALVKYRIPLGLKTTITRRNLSELEAMRQMAHNWGLQFSGAWMLTRRRDGLASEVDHLRLSPVDGTELEAAERATAEDGAEAALRESSLDNDSNFYCQAGRAAFTVTPSGEMNTCIDLTLPAALPLEIGFREAWERVKAVVDGAPPIAPGCRDCEARAYCPRCPAWSALETGTLTEPVPYLCEIAWARRARYQQHA